MKKILLLILTSFVLFSCEKEKKVVSQEVNFLVEDVISTDRQDMFINHAKDYRWFETCMRLNNFLDEENDGSLAEVVNVFQAITNSGEGFDTKVYKFQHFSNGVNATDSISGFWVEDFPLDNEPIKITYREAYDKLMATNCVKPHSRYVTLRKQVGPKSCNAQYIFGNLKMQVYVDAVTGEVSEVNPAFGEKTLNGAFLWVKKDSVNLNKPLGEWP